MNLLKPIYVGILWLCHTVTANGQVIPDYISKDNFRPYMSERQKQNFIRENQVKQSHTARTSQELHPHLYRYVKKDHLGNTRGTSTDPYQAFKNSTLVPSHIHPNSPVPQGVYSPHLSVEEKNRLIYEADQAAIDFQQKIYAEVAKDLNALAPTIKYSLGTHNGERAQPFINAYFVLRDMLTGKADMDFVKAVFVIESAYDRTLTWKGFNDMFYASKDRIERLMMQEGYSKHDNMAKIMSIYKYMADTTSVYYPEFEKHVVTQPMLYDYEDYAAKKDASKIFVSKLLRTGTGQCMSLPMLYFLYSKVMQAKDVHIALAPQHSYIKFKDAFGNWNNIELTGRMFTTEDFQFQGGFVKANQVKSGIYLKPLTDKETMAYILTTLALTYVKTFGVDDTAYQMALTAKEHFPNSLTANNIIAGYYKDLFHNILRQYSVFGLSQKQLDEDVKAQNINDLRIEAYDHVIKDLGYSKIPDWAYEAWLNSVNELANQRQHIVRKRQFEQQIK